jgi:hypothetical protein
MKGQVSFFIVVAVLLVVIISLATYLVLQEDIFVSDDAGIEKTALRSFVDGCVKSAADEGLKIISLQGGYIDLAGVQAKEIPSLETVVHSPYGFSLKKQAGTVKVPFYIYDNQISVPSLGLIEKQLGEHIKKAVLYCVDDFKSFKDEGYAVEFSEPVVTVSFASSTLVDLVFPVRISRGDESVSEEVFNYDLPVDFAKVHSAVLKTVIQEYLDGFIELGVKNLISLYSFSGVKHPDALPPLSFSVVGVECVKETWEKKAVERVLKQIISVNMPFLKIARTNFTRVASVNPTNQGVYDSFVFDILEKDMDLHFSAVYDSLWDFREFSVKPSSGSTIAPDSSSFEDLFMIGSFCSVKYDFKYTLKFPVLFEVWSDMNNEALGSNVSLKFFIEPFLCGNRIRSCTGRPSYLENLDSAGLPDEAVDELNSISICDYPNSGKITVVVQDKITKLPVEGVGVYYFCGTSKNDCSVGITNANGEVTAKLPYCDNGIFSFSKQGYFKYQNITSINFPFDKILDQFFIVPEKKMKVSVKLINAEDFAEAYYLTNGFTMNTCNGLAPGAVFNALKKEPDIGRADSVSVQVDDRKSLIGPSFVYPSPLADEGILFPPASYDISMSYSGKVMIKPSSVRGNVVSFNPLGGDYDGVFLLGSFSFPMVITESTLINKNSAEFYMLTSFISGADISTSDFMEKKFDSRGNMLFKVKVPANSLPDRGCSNLEMEMPPLSKLKYISFLMPGFT